MYVIDSPNIPPVGHGVPQSCYTCCSLVAGSHLLVKDRHVSSSLCMPFELKVGNNSYFDKESHANHSAFLFLKIMGLAIIKFLCLSGYVCQLVAGSESCMAICFRMPQSKKGVPKQLDYMCIVGTIYIIYANTKGRLSPAQLGENFLNSPDCHQGECVANYTMWCFVEI